AAPAGAPRDLDRDEEDRREAAPVGAARRDAMRRAPAQHPERELERAGAGLLDLAARLAPQADQPALQLRGVLPRPPLAAVGPLAQPAAPLRLRHALLHELARASVVAAPSHLRREQERPRLQPVLEVAQVGQVERERARARRQEVQQAVAQREIEELLL